MDVRRFSVNTVLDVTALNGYYNRLDVFLSFTDDGEYDLSGAIDGNIRPEGVYAYMINDVVGRRSRESTLYGRVFRYRETSKEMLNVQKYRIDDYELDYQKLVRAYPESEEELDTIYTLVPGQLSIRNPFSHLWQLTFRFAASRSKGMSNLKSEWTNILLALGYEAIIDKRGSGVLSSKRRPAVLILGLPANDIEDLEIVSTQRYKKEQNSGVNARIVRFNNLTKVSNARKRIKK